MNDWKQRLGVVYSTNNNFDYEITQEENVQTIPIGKQKLRVALDKRNRKGKQVTIIADFKGDEKELIEMSKILKTKCGIGGSVKDGEIILQGDFRDKVVDILTNMGYNTRKI